jgi:KUP system potassium uptake protein
MAQLTAAVSGAGSGHSPQGKHLWALALGSIGVVFGDIGTSPLYALKEAVRSATKSGATGQDAVLGILSLMSWTLFLVVTLKYVLILLNADNKGEGGTFALMALGQSVAKRSAPLILALGVAGAAFFYGDAVITPAISVLSAMEGLREIAPSLQFAALPTTVVILVGLFGVQSRSSSAPLCSCGFSRWPSAASSI